MATMKAIRVHQTGGPEVLQLESVPIPKPGGNEILVHVKAAGVIPLDIKIRAGILPAQAFGMELPYIPGVECAGTIEDLGTGVIDFKKGDRVYVSRNISGTYAEYCLASATYVHPLPNVVTFAEGAGLSVSYLTAYQALFQQASAKPGDTVLVHGASGGVGTAAVQIARAFGMKVIGTAGSPEGIELIKKIGAHFVFNHHQEGYIEEIRTIAGDSGINVIVEVFANKNLENDLTLLATDGQIAIVGGGAGKSAFSPTLTKAANIFNVSYFKAAEGQLAESHTAIQNGVEKGWLRPVLGHEFPLERARDAHTAVVSGSGSKGKIILTVV